LPERLAHFFNKIIPEATFGTKLSRNSIRLMVEEAGSIAKLGDHPVISDLAGFQEYEFGQACQVLLLGLCDNLKLGSAETLVLRDQLHKQLGYHDLEYEFSLEQRNKFRQDFLYFSGHLKNSPKWSQLKAYLKLTRLTQMAEISRDSLICEVNSMIAGDPQSLFSILGLKESADLPHHQISTTIISLLNPDLEMLKTLGTDFLFRSLSLWPGLIDKMLKVLKDSLCGTVSAEDLCKAGDIIVSQLEAERRHEVRIEAERQKDIRLGAERSYDDRLGAEGSYYDRLGAEGSYDNRLGAEKRLFLKSSTDTLSSTLLTFLDSINMTEFTRTELISHLSVRL